MSETPVQEQNLTDAMDPARAAALHAVLGLEGPAPGAGDALPPFWHQVYFWQVLPPAALGPDGHPAVGAGLVPDMGLAHRMWAGGALEFHAPLRLGETAQRHSRLEKAEHKTGRSGRLGFVTLVHQIGQGRRMCVRERQDLVYRGPFAGDRPAPPEAPADEEHRERQEFDPVLLFRYSALTMNGHRIHYDPDHAMKTEGYGGLVVHGPLLAQLLMAMAERRGGPLAAFEFRATAPLLLGEPAEVCLKGQEMWVRGPGRRLCMRARAQWR